MSTKKVRKENPYLLELVEKLRRKYSETKAPIWKAVAEELLRPRSIRKGVNVGKIDKILKDGEIALVIGKALGGGYVTRPLVVAAVSFSKKAREKIEKAGGRCMSIEDLMSENPNGSNVRIFG
ncbi:MAG: 50S ribosomal protein L18e [Thermoplasmata archaeon]|nr:50S ribosomal protein L18e [Euryarchaeota archaeon]RLF67342.1 MAG: 50S ribosomal protein L18e [Thermoplasmata archaeon]